MTTQDQDLVTLRWFVFRARRVAEHSLTRDCERLHKWAQGSMQLTASNHRQPALRIDLPEEEPFESLAGRCRPFMMRQDDLHFEKVLGALRSYVAEDRERVTTLDGLEARWNRFDPKGKHTLGYAVQTGGAGECLGQLVPDVKLADAWLYCDFGHGDTNVSSRVGDHDLDTRYHAAVMFVSNIAKVALKTLDLIRECWQDETIPFDAGEFTESVLARTEVTLPLAGVASGPVGTPPEELAAALESMEPDEEKPG